MKRAMLLAAAVAIVAAAPVAPRWLAYITAVEPQLAAWLDADAPLTAATVGSAGAEPQRLDIIVTIRIAPDGTITAANATQPGDPALRVLIADVLLGRRLAAPPPDMPMPIRLRLARREPWAPRPVPAAALSWTSAGAISVSAGKLS